MGNIGSNNGGVEMVINMKLSSEPFQKIEEGIKTVELRLLDEKRKGIQIGDYIKFSD